MTVAAPPRPPRPPRPPHGFDPDALFEEARRHRRHRQLRLVVLAFAVIAAGAGAYGAFGNGTSIFGLGSSGRSVASPQYRAVVLLVDVPGSMRANDVKPTRLDATVSGLEAFLGRLPSRLEVGVIAFSSSATIVQPPTTDRKLVVAALRSLNPEAGTALGDGLAAAVRLTVKTLQQAGVQREPGHALPAAIVLESDGAQNRGAVTPAQAAAQAKAQGIRVDGVALGTPNGVVKFGFGQQTNSIPVPPDPKTVALISRITGGVAFEARDAKRLAAVYSELASMLSR